MLKSSYFTLVLIVFGHAALAQTESDIIRQYPDKVQVSWITSYQDFNFSAGQADNSTVSYRNSSIKTGLRFRVRNLGLAFSVPVVPIHPSKGSLSKNLSLLFNFYPGKVNIRGSVRRVKGFDQQNGGEMIFRPDVNLLHFETSGTYVLNKDFSLRAPFRYFERQMKNAGSLLVMGTADYKNLQAKDSLFHVTSDLLASIGTMKVATLGTGTGYGFTLTEGNWYFTGLLTGGAELNQRQYFDMENQKIQREWQLKPVIFGQMSMGYNADKYFLGVVSFYRPGFGAVDNLDASFYRFRTALIAGVRFDEPKFLKKKQRG